MVNIVKIELRSLRDLVRLACSLRFSALYKARAGKSYYYMVFYSSGTAIVVPYVETEEELDGEYVIYNTATGEIRTSGTPSLEPREASLALIDVKKQDLLEIED